jgi:hypothetical protein
MHQADLLLLKIVVFFWRRFVDNDDESAQHRHDLVEVDLVTTDEVRISDILPIILFNEALALRGSGRVDQRFMHSDNLLRRSQRIAPETDEFREEACELDVQS